jgi:hypothetical protein
MKNATVIRVIEEDCGETVVEARKWLLIQGRDS